MSEGSAVDRPAARDADTPESPDSPAEVTKASWTYVARKSVHEFMEDDGIDIAAALTFYSVLAVFPMMIALLSLVGLFGQGRETVDTLLGILRDVGAGSAADTLEPTLTELSRGNGAGFAFVIGLAIALWSASTYVTAFGRAMNRVYEIDEGRPIWKLRPLMLLVTVVAVALCALVVLALVLTGPAARAVGDAIGAGDKAVMVWGIAKWPVMILAVVVVVALLYHATPNVRQPKFRWLSVGAVIAIMVWIIASVGFGFYVANFSRYDRTYGSLAGVIVFLLWLWITNLALVLGGEIDAELERGRQLQSGIPAEERIQLPPRDTRKSDKVARRRLKDIARGRRLRESHGARASTDADG